MKTHRTIRPRADADEYAPFYAGYVERVPDGDVVATLAGSAPAMSELLEGISEETAERGYAPGKWSLKEVVQHCADAERVFQYRALRFARGDRTELPGFEEDAYTPASRADERTLATLLDELASVRAATISLFEGLPDDTWTNRGRASGVEMTVRGLAWITAGHLLHHVDVVRERYLDS
ncbi:MAG: DinB family protein [Gemmatimonadota bacterium]|nr:DinB family protein [Gemmatimonadota bacterium]